MNEAEHRKNAQDEVEALQAVPQHTLVQRTSDMVQAVLNPAPPFRYVHVLVAAKLNAQGSVDMFTIVGNCTDTTTGHVSIEECIRFLQGAISNEGPTIQ